MIDCTDYCKNCGHHMRAHVHGCPIGTHVTIDAYTIERLRATGHPKLLKRIITRQDLLNDKDILRDVIIDALTLDGVEVTV